MKALHDLFRRASASGTPTESKQAVALEKRRLERLLRDEGLPRSAAERIVRSFFATPKG